MLENLSNLWIFDGTRWVGWCFETGRLNCPRVIWGFLRRLSWSCWTRMGRRRDPPTEWIWEVETGRDEVVVGEEVAGSWVVVVIGVGEEGWEIGLRLRWTAPNGIGDSGARMEKGGLGVGLRAGLGAGLGAGARRVTWGGTGRVGWTTRGLNCWKFWFAKFWTLGGCLNLCCCTIKFCLGCSRNCWRLEMLEMIVVVRWLALIGLVRDWLRTRLVRVGWWVVRDDDLWRGRKCRWLICRVKRFRWRRGDAEGSLKFWIKSTHTSGSQDARCTFMAKGERFFFRQIVKLPELKISGKLANRQTVDFPNFPETCGFSLLFFFWKI